MERKILALSGRPLCMLANDVAEAYGTESKRVNEAVRRNPKRFPGEDFCFELTEAEIKQAGRSQSATIPENYRNYGVKAFTREGVNMLACVLRTDAAIERSLDIVRVFSKVEELAIRGDLKPPAGKMLVDVERHVAMLQEVIDLQRKLLARIPAKRERKPVAPVSADEIARFGKLSREGLSAGQIAKETGRPQSTVRWHLRGL
jgi:hypothetical protein